MKTKCMFPALLALLMSVSCNRDVIDIPEQDTARYKLEINVPDVTTRVTSPGNEDAVSNITVYVYRSDGVLEASGSVSGSSVTLSTTTGAKTVAVLANAPAVSTVSTINALRQSISNLSDNAVGALVMYGEKSINVTADMSETVNVTRLTAKVVIKKITNALALDQYQSTPIVLKGIYLINVSAQRPYGGPASAPTAWYNKRSRASSDCPSLLYDNLASPTTSIAHGASNSTPHTFYCYPNNTTNDSSSQTWSARYTRLVVEVTIAGDTWYYPLSIPSIESNHVYEINELTITRIGSTDPDVPVSVKNATFNISVVPWVAGSSTSETI